MSPCRSLFAASWNIATSQPGHGVSACLLIAPKGLGSESQWKCWTRRSGFFCKNLVHFIHVYPLKKPNFSSVWHGPLSKWLPFEYSSTKMGSLDIQPLYSTLYPRITLTRSTSNFYSNTCQYHVSGLVMLDAFTYGKNCIVLKHTVGYARQWKETSFIRVVLVTGLGAVARFTKRGTDIA